MKDVLFAELEGDIGPIYHGDLYANPAKLGDNMPIVHLTCLQTNKQTNKQTKNKQTNKCLGGTDIHTPFQQAW